MAQDNVFSAESKKEPPMTTPDTTPEAVERLADALDSDYWDRPFNKSPVAVMLRALAAENAALRAELADANHTIVAYVAIRAVHHAEDLGLPKGHLAPHHYDILQKAGARMDSFTRAALDASK
jgi:hypothetical protein